MAWLLRQTGAAPSQTYFVLSGPERESDVAVSVFSKGREEPAESGLDALHRNLPDALVHLAFDKFVQVGP